MSGSFYLKDLVFRLESQNHFVDTSYAGNAFEWHTVEYSTSHFVFVFTRPFLRVCMQRKLISMAWYKAWYEQQPQGQIQLRLASSLCPNEINLLAQNRKKVAQRISSHDATVILVIVFYYFQRSLQPVLNSVMEPSRNSLYVFVKPFSR